MANNPGGNHHPVQHSSGAGLTRAIAAALVLILPVGGIAAWIVGAPVVTVIAFGVAAVAAIVWARATQVLARRDIRRLGERPPKT